MRRYTDSRGGSWDVVVGRESFGALYALFVPAAKTPGETRQTLLEAESQTAAGESLGAMSDEELNDLFERSEVKRLE